jgi:hypothetical protein
MRVRMLPRADMGGCAVAACATLTWRTLDRAPRRSLASGWRAFWWTRGRASAWPGSRRACSCLQQPGAGRRRREALECGPVSCLAAVARGRPLQRAPERFQRSGDVGTRGTCVHLSARNVRAPQCTSLTNPTHERTILRTGTANNVLFLSTQSFCDYCAVGLAPQMALQGAGFRRAAREDCTVAAAPPAAWSAAHTVSPRQHVLA